MQSYGLRRRILGVHMAGKPEAVPSEVTGESSADVKTEQINLRVRKGQVEFWRDAADEGGQSLSAWIKQVCTQAALETFAEIDGKYGARKGKK